MVALATTDTAYAQSATPSAAEPDIEKAKTLFGEGLKLERENNWREALERFKAVGKIKLTANVRFHIALCHENLGNATEALTQFEAALRQANSEGATQVVNAIPSHLDKLRAENGRITIKVPEKTPGLKIEIDGKPVEFNVVIGVTPGLHKITATAPDSEPSTIEVEVARGTERTVTVDLPKTTAKKTAAKKKVEQKNPYKVFQTIGAITAGAGAATNIVAIFTYLQSRRDLGNVEEVCPTLENCPTVAKNVYERGRDFNTATNVLLGVGSGIAAVGVGMFVVGTFVKPGKSTTTKPKDERPKDEKKPIPDGKRAKRSLERRGEGAVVFGAPGADLLGLGYTRSF